MATAITIKSESADYYTKVFDNCSDKSDVREFVYSLGEDSFELVGYDSNCGGIMESDVIDVLMELEEDSE